MTKQDSAVEFPGNFRVHVALSVTDVEKAQQFYEVLLGTKPSKVRPRYAKFEPIDPSVNLTLNETDEVALEGGAAHFGIQVKSIEAVHAAIERFKAADIPTITEEATTCCYAVQDKVWAIDPDGHKWEVFCVIDADVKDDLYAEAGCCSPDVVNLTPLCGSDSESSS